MKEIIVCPNCNTSYLLPVPLSCSCGYPNLSDVNIEYVEDNPLPLLQSDEINNPEVSPPVIQITCDDCGATYQSSEYAYCPYCPPPECEAQSNQVNAVIEWPWGKETVVGTLTVGRIPPTQVKLAARLESEFSNVSRLHAELVWREKVLTIQDFGSTNGTYINGRALAPRRITPLKNGDRVRFAATLEVTVRIE